LNSIIIGLEIRIDVPLFLLNPMQRSVRESMAANAPMTKDSKNDK
jgi:hypothetical protein